MRRVALALLVLAGCAVSLSPTDMQMDTFTLSTNAVNVSAGDADVTCNMTITDGSGGTGGAAVPLLDATCAIISPGGTRIACAAASPAGDIWSCPVTIPQDSEQGTGGAGNLWVVEYVATRNTADTRSVITHAQMEADVGNVISAVTDLDIAVTSTAADTTGPTISSATSTPSSLFQFLGGDITCDHTVGAGGTDAGGVQDTTCAAVSPGTANNKDRACSSVTGAGGTGFEYTCDFTVPPVAALGTWNVTASARDTLGNRSSLVDNTSFTVVIDGLDYEDCAVTTTPDVPLAVDLDDDGNAYMVAEFTEGFHYSSKASPCAAVTYFEAPVDPTANPFQYEGNPSKLSTLGESIVWDSNDSVVWFSMGGAWLAGIDNHSRVFSYEPGTGGAGGGPGGGTFKGYNLPGEGNEAVGLHWDQTRNWMWVVESGFYSDQEGVPAGLPAHPSSIIAFDPDHAAYDNLILDAEWAALDANLCTGSELPGASPTPECYKRYELGAGASSSAHLVGDPQGFIWFTNFWGTSIGRLDPATGDVIIYAEFDNCYGACPVVGYGPWQIKMSPDDLYVVWNDYGGVRIVRMLVSQAEDAECEMDFTRVTGGTGGGGGTGGYYYEDPNPCMDPLSPDTTVLPHGIDYDSQGRLWFSPGEGPGTATVGYITADWSQAVVLDPADFTPDFNPGGATGFRGIAVDPDDGEIWLCENPRALGRLALE